MKKIFFIILLAIMSLPAYSATYFILDPETHLAYRAELFTYSVKKKVFKVGLLSEICRCGNLTFRKDEGIVGGSCNDLEGNLFYWREELPDTFLDDLYNRVIPIRAKDGYQIDGSQINLIIDNLYEVVDPYTINNK